MWNKGFLKKYAPQDKASHLFSKIINRFVRKFSSDALETWGKYNKILKKKTHAAGWEESKNVFTLETEKEKNR